MRLTDTPNKIKSLLSRLGGSPDLPKDVFIALLILLVGCGGFALGRLSVSETMRKNELSITNAAAMEASAIRSVSSSNMKQDTSPPTDTFPKDTAKGMYVGSRSGKTYHLPWCSGAKRIKEENKIWFQSKEEAEGRGYRAAANCKGI